MIVIRISPGNFNAMTLSYRQLDGIRVIPSRYFYDYELFSIVASNVLYNYIISREGQHVIRVIHYYKPYCTHQHLLNNNLETCVYCYS